MPIDDHLKTAKDGAALIGELVKAAGSDPTVKEAGRELGKTALTITKTVNNALLPLAAVNFAFEKACKYFHERFEQDLAEKSVNIPPEQLIEPKASVAGPALQGLASSHNEPDLKDMYLNLISSAMDGRRSEAAHPAFVEIIRQLNSEEARLIRGGLQSNTPTPIVEIRLLTTKTGSWDTLLRHLLNLRDTKTNEPIENPRLPAMVDNWIRLGLMRVAYGTFLEEKNRYDWVESRPEFVHLLDSHVSETKKLTFEKGFIEATSLGRQFAHAVGILTRE